MSGVTAPYDAQVASRWRQTAQQLGVLNRGGSGDPHDADQAVPSASCGVSLAFLETLASSIRAVDEGSGLADEPTGVVMQVLVMPTLARSFKKSR